MTSTLDGLHNFRDTGSTPLRGGGATRPGVLYRSDALSSLTPTGVEELAASPIGVIVDFRTEQERHSAPDALPDSRPFRVVEESILQGAMAEMAQRILASGADVAAHADEIAASVPTLDGLYIGMLGASGEAFADVARLVAASTDEEPTAVLVHCTAGKDRTGVATAVLLDAAGAERSAVIADYASSERNLAGEWADGMLQMISSFGIPITPELQTLVAGSPADAIEKTLAWLDDTYGGGADYLRAAGLTDGDLTALRARLRG